MIENFPNLGRDLNIQFYEANMLPPNFNSKVSSPIHIIIKLSKIKNKKIILKAARGKKISHIRKPP